MNGFHTRPPAVAGNAVSAVAVGWVLLVGGGAHAQSATQVVLGVPDLVAFWDFAEQAGQDRVAQGVDGYALSEGAGVVQRVAGGPFSGYAANFTGSQFLTLASADLGALNINGGEAQVTVVAWVKRKDSNKGFIGGIWNEGDLKRQYGMFVDLAGYGGPDNVIGHVSASGGPTPGYPFSRDYSANQTDLLTNQWYTIAFTYDGQHARSYVDGKFEGRPTYTDVQGETYAKNPYYFPDGLSDRGGDFTVGAVRLGATPGAMGNWLNGQIGGLAVYDRALSGAELFELHEATTPEGEPFIRFGFDHVDASTHPASSLAWRSYVQGSGEVSGSGSNGWQVTSAAGVGTTRGYLARNSTGAAGLAWTDSTPEITTSQLDRVEFTMNNASAADSARLAIRVNDNWFVTTDVFQMSDSDGTQSNWSTEAESFALNPAATSWHGLNFDQSATLQVMTSSTNPLPYGAVQSIGFYHEANVATLRFDDLRVFTDYQAPGILTGLTHTSGVLQSIEIDHVTVPQSQLIGVTLTDVTPGSGTKGSLMLPALDNNVIDAAIPADRSSVVEDWSFRTGLPNQSAAFAFDAPVVNGPGADIYVIDFGIDPDDFTITTPNSHERMYGVADKAFQIAGTFSVDAIGSVEDVSDLASFESAAYSALLTDTSSTASVVGIDLSDLGYSLGQSIGSIGLNTALYDTMLIFGVPYPTAALTGDYNGDGAVDAGDYTVWRDHLGDDAGVAFASNTRGPANTGPVGPDDYVTWKLHFGTTLGSSAGLGSAQVPEPTALVGALLVVCASGRLTRRSNGQLNEFWPRWVAGPVSARLPYRRLG